MSLQLLFTLILIIFLCIIIKNLPENFVNYLSVADNKDLYVRFLDYLHGEYQLPDAYRRGYFIYDIYGFPHYIHHKSDPYIINYNRFPNEFNYPGQIWHQPHNRKIIKI